MKKIKSESKFQDDEFKIKIGTIDKKNPEVIYIEIGSYISPIVKKSAYKPYISKIEKKIKSVIENVIKNSRLCNDDFIFVSDIAEERIDVNKKSYFELQLFVKPINEIKNNMKFFHLAEKFNETFVSKIIPCIKTVLNDNDFEYYKSRK